MPLLVLLAGEQRIPEMLAEFLISTLIPKSCLIGNISSAVLGEYLGMQLLVIYLMVLILSEARPELSSRTLIPMPIHTRLLNWFCPHH